MATAAPPHIPTVLLRTMMATLFISHLLLSWYLHGIYTNLNRLNKNSKEW